MKGEKLFSIVYFKGPFLTFSNKTAIKHKIFKEYIESRINELLLSDVERIVFKNLEISFIKLSQFYLHDFTCTGMTKR